MSTPRKLSFLGPPNRAIANSSISRVRVQAGVHGRVRFRVLFPPHMLERDLLEPEHQVVHLHEQLREVGILHLVLPFELFHSEFGVHAHLHFGRAMSFGSFQRDDDAGIFRDVIGGPTDILRDGFEDLPVRLLHDSAAACRPRVPARSPVGIGDEFHTLMSTTFICNSLRPFHSFTPSSNARSTAVPGASHGRHSPSLNPMNLAILPSAARAVSRRCLPSPTVSHATTETPRAANTGRGFFSPNGSSFDTCSNRDHDRSESWRSASILRVGAKSSSLMTVSACFSKSLTAFENLSSPVTEKPQACGCPPNRSRFPSHRCSAAVTSNPPKVRPEPTNFSPSLPTTYTGREKSFTSFPATKPTSPAGHPSFHTTITFLAGSPMI